MNQFMVDTATHSINIKSIDKDDYYNKRDLYVLLY